MFFCQHYVSRMIWGQSILLWVKGLQQTSFWKSKMAIIEVSLNLKIYKQKYVVNPAKTSGYAYLDLANFLEEFFVIWFLIEMHSSTPDSTGKTLGIGNQGCDVWWSRGKRVCTCSTAQSIATETIPKLYTELEIYYEILICMYIQTYIHMYRYIKNRENRPLNFKNGLTVMGWLSHSPVTLKAWVRHTRQVEFMFQFTRLKEQHSPSVSADNNAFVWDPCFTQIVLLSLRLLYSKLLQVAFAIAKQLEDAIANNAQLCVVLWVEGNLQNILI